MARYGFIHDKLDIKFLILYFMARVAAPIDFPTLTELTVCDDGIGYFEFAEAVSELVESGHLTLEDGLYSITEKGRENGAACESSLPYSVKRNCSAQLVKLNGILRRNAQVRAETEPRPEGGPPQAVRQRISSRDNADIHSCFLLPHSAGNVVLSRAVSCMTTPLFFPLVSCRTLLWFHFTWCRCFTPYPQRVVFQANRKKRSGRRRSAYFFVEAYCFSKVKISPSRSIAMVLPS